MAWAVLVILSFFIPNEFFLVWGNYFAMSGSVLFILYGLILLIDAAHSWAETCLERYEATESKTWEIILVGSTFAMYAGAIAMIILSYIFFAGTGCGLNQTFISLNLVLAIIVTGMAIHPTIQEYNSRSGLAQSAMVCIYATYLTLSAVCNGTTSPLLWRLID
jgi:serine incorporator 1/3